MKTISIATPEEEAGKSALTVHFAHHLREAGANVLAIDLDYKGDTSCALRDFATNMTVPQMFLMPGNVHLNDGITLIRSNTTEDQSGWMRGRFSLSTEHAARLLGAQLALAADVFDICVIDTSPGLCHRSRAALALSDLLVVPVTGRQGAATHASVAVDIYRSLRGQSGQCAAIVPSRLSAPCQAEIIRSQLREEHFEHALECHIDEDAAIPDALRGRVPIWAYKTQAARRSAQSMLRVLGSLVDCIQMDGVAA